MTFVFCEQLRRVYLQDPKVINEKWWVNKTLVGYQFVERLDLNQIQMKGGIFDRTKFQSTKQPIGIMDDL